MATFLVHAQHQQSPTHSADDRYNQDGRFAELRTVNAKGKILSRATVGTLPNEVMACIPGSNGRGPARQWLHLFELLVRDGTAANGAKLP